MLQKKQSIAILTLNYIKKNNNNFAVFFFSKFSLKKSLKSKSMIEICNSCQIQSLIDKIESLG